MPVLSTVIFTCAAEDNGGLLQSPTETSNLARRMKSGEEYVF